ncbi:hypothetical protein [Thioflexithrix psekupsensis]|uniref:DUF2269 domain-containing protein n=1 Tax=Thioflexithrix psekupsensis TaxID=1570016 RepID=A0A251X5B9_9GAMM|nr:hypothetical protein [Thioflexithrix psekupsensis]OUD12399.1 hypothetical protein TPSD3_14915 [Thioflexithrix psekupsensis]
MFLINLLSIILLLLLGLMAASVYLQAQSPPLRPVLEKLTQFQGMLGVSGLIFGVIWLIILLIKAGYVVLMALFGLACIFVLLSLGVLMGSQWVERWLQGSEQQQYLRDWRARLLPYQTQLGLAALVLSGLQLLWLIF